MLIFAVTDTARRPVALGGMAEQIFRWQRREGDCHLLISIDFSYCDTPIFQFEPFSFDHKRMEEIEFKTFAKKD